MLDIGWDDVVTRQARPVSPKPEEEEVLPWSLQRE